MKEQRASERKGESTKREVTTPAADESYRLLNRVSFEQNFSQLIGHYSGLPPQSNSSGPSRPSSNLQ